MTSNSLGNTLACIYVDLRNNGTKEVSFNEYGDWKAQTPGGVITDPTVSFNDDNLGDGKLAPNGAKSGSVCFDESEPGEYGFIYKELISFSNETATWKTAF
ncbi:Telomeric repeat-binding factor 2 [Corynebacterium renale]|nr:DUF4352 domain-containing protein [Corynebacterium renale]SQG63337.1 Telomeric repeat-binding factor 2 [Corynebacterium renale]